MAVANAFTGRRILVADDSSTIQKVIKIAFSRHSAEIVEAGSFIEALAAIARATPDALILDASLPGAHGPADFAKLAEGAGRAPVLLLVGTYEAVDENEFRKAGFQHFLKKPFESADLVQLVDSLLASHPARSPGPALTATGRPVQTTTVFHPPGTFPGIDPTTRQNSSHVVPPPPSITNPGIQPPLSYRGALDEALQPLVDEQDEQDDDDEGATTSDPVPPPPLSETGRKGRRAFSGDEVDVTRAPGGPSFSSGLGNDDMTAPRRAAARDEPQPMPLPTIPKSAGLGGAPARPSDGEASLDLGLDDEPAPRGVPAPSLAGSGASWPHQLSPMVIPAPRAAAPDVDALLPFIEEQLPGLVRQMVEAYCERHFQGLAREIIAGELRRLADEKARHLVDN